LNRVMVTDATGQSEFGATQQQLRDRKGGKGGPA